MQSLARPPVLSADDNEESYFMPNTLLIGKEMMSESIKILCVEDDKDSCELLDFILSREGFEVVSCSTSKEGLHLAKRGGFSAIVLDYCLPEISGLEICREIRSYDKQTLIIFYTASAYPKDKEAGLKAGANAYLIKPNDLDKIAETITDLVSISDKALTPMLI
jgi:OmpR-family two-component system manganese-sensing response regulator